MQILGLVVLLGFLAIFVLIVFLMVRSARRASVSKESTALSLGFTRFDADEALLEKIASVYPHFKVQRQYELRNLFRKHHPDGELLLFDLVDTHGEDSSYLEDQAVAVVSPALRLPPLFIFPKSDLDGWVSGLANRAMEWVVGRMGDPLEFPEHPKFSKRYVVSSSDPGAARAFLDAHILDQLGNTRLLSIAMNGDTFILSSIDLQRKSSDRGVLVERLDHATRFFTLFR